MKLSEANVLFKQLGDKSDIIVALIDLKTGEDMEKLSNQINHLGVQLNAKLDSMDAKFEAKFDSVDTRFDSMDAKFEAKFDSVDTRFDSMDAKFEAKFDSVDTRFDSINARLDSMDTKFTALFNVLKWCSVTIIGFIIASTSIILNVVAK